MKTKCIRRNFTIPEYLANQLSEVSSLTGFTQSTLMHQALNEFLHKFKCEGTIENWLIVTGKVAGLRIGDDHE